MKRKGVGTFKRFLDTYPSSPLADLIVKIAVLRLKLAGSRAASMGDRVDLAFRWRLLPMNLGDFFTMKPIQVREELEALLTLVNSIHPKTVLEIGTARGGTLYLFTSVATPDAVITTVDLPEGPFGGGYPTWKIPIYRSFTKGRQRIVPIRADSHDSSSLEKVKRILGGRVLDFLFIDGDHGYEGVRRDYEMYSPLTTRGSLIAFHDIVRHPPESGCEVNEFWNEVKHSCHYREIVRDCNQGWGGIGVLFVGKYSDQSDMSQGS